jgi:hypothetical protein
MFEELRAPDEIVEARRKLAGKVREVLDLAGIPNYYIYDAELSPGAVIEVDFGVEEMSGVFIIWRPGETLYQELLAAVRKRPSSDPVIALTRGIRKHMRDAILKILQDQGFEVTAVDDYETMPPAIHVHQGPPIDE